MEAVYDVETLFLSYQTAWRNILQDNHLHFRFLENLKSHFRSFVFTFFFFCFSTVTLSCLFVFPCEVSGFYKQVLWHSSCPYSLFLFRFYTIIIHPAIFMRLLLFNPSLIDEVLAFQTTDFDTCPPENLPLRRLAGLLCWLRLEPCFSFYRNMICSDIRDR
jgi:hypothetical protein